MERPIRKRVTRVGSGAYSIYLPKKWIDAWLPEQKERREVDLHRINDALLVVPVLQDRHYRAKTPTDPETVERILLSAYVQGYREATLTPRSGAFGTGTQIRSRDVLRHTDERLVAEVGPSMIGFRLEAGMPAPFASSEELLLVMAAKTREVLRLAGEAIDAYTHDPERALHALQLLQADHDEDVARLWHQALRVVARVELPLQTITDFQMLDLLAAELHAASGHAVQIGAAILEEGGLGPEALEYPLGHLLAQWPRLPPPPAAVQGMIRSFRPAFDAIRTCLHDALEAIQARDAVRLQQCARAIHAAQQSLQQRVFDNTVAHWGEQPGGIERGITASRIIQPLDHILASLHRLCERGALLLAARPGGPA